MAFPYVTFLPFSFSFFFFFFDNLTGYRRAPIPPSSAAPRQHVCATQNAWVKYRHRIVGSRVPRPLRFARAPNSSLDSTPAVYIRARIAHSCT
ncbi:hypothetical protein C8R45DRAFT_971880 [Mycena sanguinolenta]|nr:hypothetical protein C8R45DRAFT_971880 [Mycena sanguinolenta]